MSKQKVNMKNILKLLLIISVLNSCYSYQTIDETVITSDIENFWIAYDKITSVKDSNEQLILLDSLYLKKGTPGLKAIREARNYTPEDFLNSINNYPKFWTSIRNNTLKVNQYKTNMVEGIDKLKEYYPELKPAKIYFTIGAFRTGGTTLDSLVLIGSEISMTDSTTVTEEFPESLSHLPAHFKTNPLDHLTFLNIHEYIHTQQKPIVHNLLSQSIREGVAEFVPTVILNTSSPNPQIEFGKQNAKRIREVYEHELFYVNNLPKWLNSNASNEFGMRDLAYYVGYQMCENYYQQATNKKDAIREMINLDYSNETEIEEFVKTSNYLSEPLEQLYEKFQSKRPTVINIKQFKNKGENVSPSINEITIEFSEPLNGYNTGVDLGDLGRAAFPKGSIEGRTWGKENKSWTLPVSLEANKKYQILISNNFRTNTGIPLKPYLIEFKTANK